MKTIIRTALLLFNFIVAFYTEAGALADKKYSVGEIPIQSDVTILGARTYSVPINVYPGANGLTPSLSFVYNSQQGSSILGQGWSIGGLNMIVRVAKDMYHDGVISPVLTGAEDAFCIDGIRLIELSRNYKERRYETEQGNIKAIAHLNDTVVTHFEVFYPDGRKGIFGYPDKNRRHVYYPLTQLSDAQGNLVNYTYITHLNYYYISKIVYNRDVSIEFEYIHDRPDHTLAHYGGFTIQMQKLLTKVKCKLGNVLLCEYGLEYETKYSSSVLSRISYSAGGEAYNPLNFSYGKNRELSSYRTVETKIPGEYHVSSSQALKLVKGRFDTGQDNEGVITIPSKNPYYKHHRNATAFRHSQSRFLNEYHPKESIIVHGSLDDGNTVELAKLQADSGFVDIVCADLHGNCRDCIIKINDNVRNNLDEVSFRVYENDGKRLKNTATRKYSFPTLSEDGAGYKSIQPKFYYPGDFDGDGKMEILAVSAHCPIRESGPNTEIYLFDLLNDSILYKGSPIQFTVKFLGSNLSDPIKAENESDKLFVMDCDGDGKADICYIGSNGLSTYTFDVQPSGLKLRKLSFFANPSGVALKEKRLIPGDFNCDGIGDFVIAPIEESEMWAFVIGMGKGNFRYMEYQAETLMVPDEDTAYFVVDVNNDGTTDILAINRDKKPYTGYDRLFTHIVDAFGFSKSMCDSLQNCGEQIVPVKTNRRYSPASLIGIYDDVITKYVYRADESCELAVSQIVNSYGVVQKNTYEAIGCGSPVFTAGSGASFPFANVATGKTVLSAGKTYLGDTLVDSESYRYENAVANLQGLGFCGFEKVTKTDLHGDKEICTYSPTEYGVLKSKESPKAKSKYIYDIDHRQYGLTKIRLTNKTEDDLLNGNRTVTEYAYDSYGNPLREHATISNYGSITRTAVYDSYPYIGASTPYLIGLPTEETTTVSTGSGSYATKTATNYQLGLPVRRCHFVNGNKVNEENFVYDNAGNPLSVSVNKYSSKNIQTIAYTYDDYGRVVKTVDPLGLTEEYNYDSYGRKSSVKDCRGNFTAYEYDPFGRLTAEIAPDGTASRISREWEKTGDVLFSVISSGDGEPTVKESYDALGRLVEQSEQRFDGSWLKSYRRYDKFGNISETSLPTKSEPKWVSYKYDRFDRLLSTTAPDGKKILQWHEPNTEITVSDGIEKVKTYNPRGELVSVTDPSGTIEYSYAPDGQIEKIVAPDGHETVFGYDSYRRRISVTDPNSGLITYEYDADGNLIYELINDFYNQDYEYDEYGRLTWKRIDVSEYNYVYDEFGNLESVDAPGVPVKKYVYDSFGRLSSQTEYQGENTWFRRTYTYSDGNISSVDYESDLGKIATENYIYSNGHLSEIRLGDGTVVYKLESENDLGLTDRLKTGDFVREYGYTPTGLPSMRRASHPKLEVQKYSYSFDRETSNLLSRTDSVLNRNERFTYDYQNRLTGWGGGEAEYDPMGSVIRRSDVGEFSYTREDKPYSVTELKQNAGVIPLRKQNLTFLYAGYPSDIWEGNTRSRILYDESLNRTFTSLIDVSGGNRKYSLLRYYLGGCYEREERLDAPLEERLYLGGGYYDAAAVLVKTDSVEDVHYIFRDYLGSVTQLCKADGTLVQELEYDPWGRVSLSDRSPESERGYYVYPRLGRGFCGHEHLPYYGLINMNARMYDPAIGRFLSPDPLVQSPDWSQNFNRYTYAMNNPLRYVDEDGEFVIPAAVIAAALIGGAINVAAHWEAILEAGGGWSSIWKATQYFGVGGLAGGAGAGVAAIVAPTAIGFVPGAVAGMTAGATEGIFLGLGNGAVEHSSFGTSVGAALKGGLIGALSGGIGGGAIGTLEARALGRNLWTGAVIRDKYLRYDLKLPLDGLDLPTYDVTPYSKRPSVNERTGISLYEGVDKNGVVRYVGITSRDPKIRFEEHLRSKTPRAKLKYRVVDERMYKTWLDGRIAEQRAINKYGLENLLNRRNEIAEKYWEKYGIFKNMKN